MSNQQNDQNLEGGTLIRGADGSIYFLRDEMLEACRVTQEDAIPFLNQLLDQDQEVEGFVLKNGATTKAVSLSGPFGPATPISQCTYMCTGSMSLRTNDFQPRMTKYLR
jgi:hypothetical protein